MENVRVGSWLQRRRPKDGNTPAKWNDPVQRSAMSNAHSPELTKFPAGEMSPR
jgi:hypothetical protein